VEWRLVSGSQHGHHRVVDLDDIEGDMVARVCLGDDFPAQRSGAREVRATGKQQRRQPAAEDGAFHNGDATAPNPEPL
jgi:hypothetical protein